LPFLVGALSLSVSTLLQGELKLKLASKEQQCSEKKKSTLSSDFKNRFLKIFTGDTRALKAKTLILKQWIWLRELSTLENQREDIQGVGQRKPDDGHLDFESCEESEIAQGLTLRFCRGPQRRGTGLRAQDFP